MINKKTLFLILLIGNYFIASAQIFTAKKYPKNYFAWPLKNKPALAANFGELRPDHYHMGLDCKTDKRENLEVMAAADGYVAKVKIEPYGFGRCIYINHPNGLTTVYAHLNEFNPELEKYVTAQQYALKSWKIFIDIPSTLFPVKKGNFIAFSGNTGGSQGPHMHFEIRDTKTDKVLNPLLFNFPIIDNIPPSILRLAVYDRCRSTYEQSPHFYTLKKVNGNYITTPSLIISNTDKVSFGITAFDTYTGSTNKNGIFEADLYENEKPIVGFQLDSISYDETRYLNAHIDYKLRYSGGPFVEHISRLPGYPQSVYKDVSGDGVIQIDDDSIHKIKILVKDANGNQSILKFDIKRGFVSKEKMGIDSFANFQKKQFHPGFVNIFENNKVSFYMSEKCLYDSFQFKYNELLPASGYPIYQLQSCQVPVQTMFNLKIKNTSTTMPNKMVMHRFGNGKDDYCKAVPEAGNWFKGQFRNFGNFQLLEDVTPPMVTPIGFANGMNCSKATSIKFVIIDNTEELINFTALLDGNWLRFTNDKGKTFIYKFDEKCAAGSHELKISVSDCVGNLTEKIYHFTR